MKRLTLFLAIVIGVALARAQDVIITKNGDEIKSKIQEVGLDLIKYRRYDNLDGPLFTIAKSSVFQIKYANGSTEMFDKATQLKAQAKPMKIEKRGDWYYRDGEILYEDAIANIIYDSKDKNAINEVKQAVAAFKLAKPLTIAGIVFSAAGMGAFLIGGFVMRNTNPYNQDYVYNSTTGNYNYQNSGENPQYNFARDVSNTGLICGLVGIAALSTGIVVKANGKTHLEKAVRHYNATIVE